MTERTAVRIRGSVRVWAAAPALAISALVAWLAVAVHGQDTTVQQPVSVTGPDEVFSTQGAQTPPDVFASGGEPVYTDEFSSSCEKSNANNPYAGMDPLKCYGVMAPADSAGKCSLGGMQVLKQEGSTCYYCQPINPPTQGFIIPFDDLATADNQGFLCGVNQADPQCSAICTGTGTFKPPPGTTLQGQTPSEGTASGGKPPLQGYVSNTPDACMPFGPTGYNFCNNPPGTKLPAGCVCPQLQPDQPQTACSATEPSFTDYLLSDAQTELQNAGKISKAMTDAMDVTKHNDVGVKVAVSSAATVACGVLFSAAANYVSTAAQQFKTLATAKCIATTEQNAFEQIAGNAATDSTTAANEATQSASELQTAGGAATNVPGYLEDATILSSTPLSQTPYLPSCGAVACVRLAQLIKSNASIFRLLQNLKPNLVVKVTEETTNGVTKGVVTTSGGLTSTQLAQGLNASGISAQVGTGMTNMMNAVRGGKPVIALVYPQVCTGAPAHFVVVKEVLNSGTGAAAVQVYDPMGFVYSQPAATFQRYFAGAYVSPL
jgi:hypothetical protein